MSRKKLRLHCKCRTTLVESVPGKSCRDRVLSSCQDGTILVPRFSTVFTSPFKKVDPRRSIFAYFLSSVGRVDTHPERVSCLRDVMLFAARGPRGSRASLFEIDLRARRTG